MMRFEITYNLSDGSIDSFIVEGETVKEVQTQANIELAKRGGQNAQSRELELR